MKRRCFFQSLFLLALGATVAPAFQPTGAESARWQKEAQNITIVRDDWGIAHIFGKTDADAVFGAEYAQAEDDFNRVETNYINAAGRLAEAEGESKIFQDLRMRLFRGPDALKSSASTRQPGVAARADGRVGGRAEFLPLSARQREAARHPAGSSRGWRSASPRAVSAATSSASISSSSKRFTGSRTRPPVGQPLRPANPLPLVQLARQHRLPQELPDREPRGSNGMAVAPSNTSEHHALLLINPHTSFFFRSELQMTSDEGREMNAYGAVTWGQFFVYQGFNDRAGWMHTSSGADAIDEYLETVTRKGGRIYYKYGNEERLVETAEITVPYRTGSGMAEKKFTIYRTGHGPVIREENGKWVTIRLMQEPVKSLTQSYTRTKARSYKAFRETMELHTNSSNNTVFADADGDIAYFHANFIPRRDTRFDWTKPVDGSNPVLGLARAAFGG